MLSAEEEDHQEQVASEHVGKETERERQWSNKEEGEQLKRSDEDVSHLRNTRHEHDLFDVLEGTLLAHTYVVEDQEGDDCQDIRKAHSGHRRELQERNDAEEIVHQDESEEREQVRNKAHELMSDDIFSKILANKAVDALTCVLQSRWHDSCFARRDDEESRDEDYREKD